VNKVLTAALELQSFCEERSWRFCFIGGIAVLRWGEPRETRDADLTLLTGFGGEKPFIDALLNRFSGRIADAASFALANRVLLLRASSGVGLDISLGALAYEELVIRRSTPFDFPCGATLITCSAEDLIVQKAFAGRTQDWADIERIAFRQRDKLDWQYVEGQLTPLLEIKSDSSALPRLRDVRTNFGG
jgi:hypothetical protein